MTENGKQNVVLVDTYSLSRRLPAAFQAVGFGTIRVQSTPEVPRVYHAGPDPCSHLADITYRGDLAETVRALEPWRPVAVLAAGENGVELADSLSEALGTPSNGTTLSRARRDKYVMVERIKSCGLPGAAQLLVQSEEQLRDWHEALGGRVVLKPLRSAGGDGVTWSDDPEDSVAGYRRLKGRPNIFSEPGDGVVAQEYLVGAEYLVNTVSRDGRHHACDIWKTHRISANGVPDLAAACHLLPRRGEPQEQLVDQAFRLLDALGIRHGPAHVELKMTPAGPCVMEVGARICGLDLPGLTELACGESQIGWTVDAYLRPDLFLERYESDYRMTRSVAWAAMISPFDGILRGYPDLGELANLDSAGDIHLRVQPGERITRTIDDSSYPLAMTLAHDVDEILLRDLGTVRYLDGKGFYDVQPGDGRPAQGPVSGS
jgi:hypothetical protein